MPRNGSGLYVPPPANYPAVSATLITAANRNAIDADIATALTNSLAVNGESVVTADIPFGNNKLTGVKDGTLAKDAANVSQIQNSNAILLASVAGTDTITASLSPALTAYANGQIFTLIPANTNTGAVTININGLGAKSITKNGSTALVAGDLVAGVTYSLQYDGTRFQRIAGSDYAKSDNYAKSGANSDITSLSALSSVNGGALAGFRNYIINGNCQVAQRAQGVLSATYAYGSVDGFKVAAISGTGVSGVIGQYELSPGVLGYGVVGSWTNGQFSSVTAIESVDSAKLNGKTISISAKAYQNTGGARSFEILVYSPTVADNYAASTLLSTSTAQAAPHDTITAISHTFTLGASAASNGLAVYVRDTATNSVVSKSYIVGSVQLEEGSIATPIENRPYATELTLCRRYYWKTYNRGVNAGAITTQGQLMVASQASNYYLGSSIALPVEMHKTPTVSAYSPVTGTIERGSVNGIDFGIVTYGGQSAVAFNVTNVLSLVNQFLTIHLTAEASIL